ncbi:MAG: nuclear transport factor 2 family protein [Oligoflexia bacterium]|nr:nuclear transport factor 2 family protein [Oligoflexia bacterium]
MKDQNLKEFCGKWLKSWSGNRPDHLIEFYSDNIFYLDPAKPQGIHGKDALFRYFKKLLAIYPNWKWSLVELFPNEKGFVLKWEAQLSAESESKKFYGVDIVEIHNQKITRNEVYFDPKNLS